MNKISIQRHKDESAFTFERSASRFRDSLRQGFRENPTGNNGDVFRDLADGPLTPVGHLRDSATPSAAPFARGRHMSRAIVSTFQRRQTTYSILRCTATPVNLLIVARGWRRRDLMNLAFIPDDRSPNLRESRIYGRVTRYIFSSFTRD